MSNFVNIKIRALFINYIYRAKIITILILEH